MLAAATSMQVRVKQMLALAESVDLTILAEEKMEGKAVSSLIAHWMIWE